MTEVGLEVRALDGSTTTVALPPNSTIADLKAALLNDSFPPAVAARNFHIFSKGAKLGEQGRVSDVTAKEGDFLVLVPFMKRTRRSVSSKDVFERSTTSGENEITQTSLAADSAWLDLMQDVASLSSAPVDHPSPSRIVPSMHTVEGSTLSHGLETMADQLIRDIIFSVDDDGRGPGPQTLGKICGVVETVGCLSDRSTGKCLLFGELHKDMNEVEKCICPLWLKNLVKCFAFVNIFYGIQQMQYKCLNWNSLKEALNECSIEDICVTDMEKLAVLCSKVVVVVQEGGVLPRSRNPVIIFDDQGESQNHRMSLWRKNRMSNLSVLKTIRKRDDALRSDLWGFIKCFMGKAMPDISFFDIDDLIVMSQHNLKGRKVNLKKSRSAPESQCYRTDLLQPKQMVEHLRTGFGNQEKMIHLEKIDAKPAVFSELPGNMSETTKKILKGIGICKLYLHQVNAIQASFHKKHVVITTSTSSGKSLCYNLPVIEEMSKNIESCFLYLFPTKALAQDQLRSLIEMTKGSNINLNVGVYDGDTPKDHRIWLRDNARVLISNPDMLHVSILPHHGQFQRILSNLRFVVIDEAHMYNGVFGCHVAFILRRLCRLCSHIYGSDPSFIFCSATSANPSEHVMELANLQNVELIQNDGSPCGSKLFLLWNPSACSMNDLEFVKNMHKSTAPIARRPSPILETSRLFAEMVQHGLRCIAFCKTRKLCELVLCYTQEILKDSAPNLVDSVSSYRGGYTIEDRRRIETDLFSGKLCGVAATNALELGIDVGYIDATLHLGFPGSIASLWQQAGRSGRRVRPSLAIYIAFEGPLDQYFMKYPRKLFDSQIECCLVNPHNEQLLQQHLVCAALEHPLNLNHDKKFFGASLDSMVSSLLKKGYLCNGSRGNSFNKVFEYIGPEKSPSHDFSIRAIETDRYKVVNLQNYDIIEEIEESKAFFQVYEGAVYINQGIIYLVKNLDLSKKVAFCQKADLKYYTKTRDYTDIHVIGGDLVYPPSNHSSVQYMKTTARVNKCIVTTCWFGFYRIHCGSKKIFDRVDLSLPRYSYESQAVWIHLPQSIKVAVEIQELSFRAGQHAACHALRNVVPLYLMCNSSDLSTECANPHENRDIPERLLLYDQHPGGIGISAQVQHLFNELLAASLQLVIACTCVSNSGCPNCIQSFSCGEYNEVLDKKAAIIILQGIVDAEKSYFEST